MKLYKKRICLASFLGLCLMGSQISAEETLVGISPSTGKPVQSTEKTEESASPEAEVSASNGWKVCIDPGHQGSWVDMSELEASAPGSSEMKAKATTGTQGHYSGLCEYELNLGVSLVLREELEERGYEVVMTREDHDKAISNKERAELAASEGADILVRIHANGSDSESVRGALTMVPSRENPYVGYMFEDCYKLGEDILTEYCKATGFPNLDVGYYDNMSGINWSTIPVTILEMGFMTNPDEDLQMAEETFWPTMADGIANGIDLYFADKKPQNLTEAANKEDHPEQAPETENNNDHPEPAPETENNDHPEPAPETEASSEGKTEAVSAVASEKKTDDKAEQTMRALHDELEESLAQKKADGENWSLEVVDLSSGASCALNDGVQQAASLIKLYIMGAVFERYDELSDLHGQEYIDGLLYDMITVSDNTAANTLTNYLGDGDDAAGREAVTQYCRDNGYENTVMGRMLLAPKDNGDNVTSVSDCAEFLQKAYNNEIPHSETIISYLKQQQRRHKIPAGLPDGVESGNKTGELDDVENDVAIIFGDKPYIICVMSEYLHDPWDGQQDIAHISSEVYQFVQNAFE